MASSSATKEKSFITLTPDGPLIVKPNPLVALDQVGDLHLVVPDVAGSFQKHFADFIVGQESALFGVLAGLASVLGL